MNSNKTIGVAFVGVLLAAGSAYAASDSWTAAKVKVALLTTDGAGRTAVKADTEAGKVTLHGKVESQAVKEKAESTAREVEGVTSVNNLIQVVPEARQRVTKAMDKDVKDAVNAALKANKTLDGVHLDSVDNGLVLLSGRVPSWDVKLRAIETTYGCAGVHRVSSLIEVGEK